MEMKDIVSICMYISNMENYIHYNKEYQKFFQSQPPVRVCVEVPLPPDVPILIDALVYHREDAKESEDNTKSYNTRQSMHVQSVSHWAPANIGPYSQAVWV